MTNETIKIMHALNVGDIETYEKDGFYYWRNPGTRWPEGFVVASDDFRRTWTDPKLTIQRLTRVTMDSIKK